MTQFLSRCTAHRFSSPWYFFCTESTTMWFSRIREEIWGWKWAVMIRNPYSVIKIEDKAKWLRRKVRNCSISADLSYAWWPRYSLFLRLPHFPWSSTSLFAAIGRALAHLCLFHFNSIIFSCSYWVSGLYHSTFQNTNSRIAHFTPFDARHTFNRFFS